MIEVTASASGEAGWTIKAGGANQWLPAVIEGSVTALAEGPGGTGYESESISAIVIGAATIAVIAYSRYQYPEPGEYAVSWDSEADISATNGVHTASDYARDAGDDVCSLAPPEPLPETECRLVGVGFSADGGYAFPIIECEGCGTQDPPPECYAFLLKAIVDGAMDLCADEGSNSACDYSTFVEDVKQFLDDIEVCESMAECGGMIQDLLDDVGLVLTLHEALEGILETAGDLGCEDVTSLLERLEDYLGMPPLLDCAA
jgi:hypothetical protein